MWRLSFSYSLICCLLISLSVPNGWSADVGANPTRQEAVYGHAVQQKPGERREVAGEKVSSGGAVYTGLAPNQTLTEEDWIRRQRNKNIRLFQIQSSIMEELRLRSRPNMTGVPTLSPAQSERIRAELDRKENMDGTDYSSKRVYSLYPTCPFGEQSWLDTSTDVNGIHRYKLYFDVDLPDQLRNSRTKLTRATLELTRKPPLRNDRRRQRTAEGRAEAETGAERVSGVTGGRAKGKKSPERARGAVDKAGGAKVASHPPRRNDTGVRRQFVQLDFYKFTPAPIGARRPQDVKTLIKSVRLKPRVTKVKINIKPVVKDWLVNQGTNRGLEIQITDDQENRLDPLLYLEGYNCSTAALLYPDNVDSASHLVPVNAVKVSPNVQSSTTDVSSPMYPVLHLSTVNKPRAAKKHNRHERVQSRVVVRERNSG